MNFKSLLFPIARQLTDLTLRTRIFGLIFISLVSTALLLGGSVTTLHGMGMEIRMLVETNMPISKTLSSIEVHELDHTMLLMERHAVRNKVDDGHHKAVLKKFFNYLDEVDEELSISRQMAQEATGKASFEKYQAYFQEVENQLASIDDRQHRLAFLIKQTFEHINHGNTPAVEENKKNILEEKAMLLLQMRELVLFIQDMSDRSLREMEEEYARLYIFLPAAFVGVFLILFMLARTVLHHILQPLNKAIAGTNALIHDHALILTPGEMGGEMGQLLRAMDHLAETLRERDDLRKRLAISEKMSTIGRLAVGVAHEINNPLASATVGLQNLQTKLQNVCQEQEIHHRFAQVERNIQRAGQVAREMLEFAWSGELQVQPVAVCDELDFLLEQYPLDEKNIRLKRNYQTQPMVRGDENKLARVFDNLLKNALDAMPQGGSLTVSVTQPFPQWVIVLIADSGAGIAPEILSKIMEPFYTTKQLGKGTGLGLPICLSLVEQHHGHMEINSVEGHGTSVVVTLPTWKETP